MFKSVSLTVLAVSCAGCGAATSTPFQEATWLIIAWNEQTASTATGFAVAPTVLATNAHVVQGIVEIFRGPNPHAVAVQHETGERRTIIEVASHPAYWAPERSPDVGLLVLDRPVFPTLRLADDATIEAVEVFDAISLCGFPGAVTDAIDPVTLSSFDELRPRASCLRGSVSALRPFSPSEPATPESVSIIQYDLALTQGTSGSPVVNDDSEVIAVNSFRPITGGSYGFATRANHLQELLDQLEDGRAVRVILGSLPDRLEGAIPGITCDPSYFSPTWGFGLDVPGRLDGPVVSGYIPAPFEIMLEFAPREPASVPDELTSVRVAVVTDPRDSLDDSIATWLTATSMSRELLSLDEITVASGLRGYLATWVRPSILGDPRDDLIVIDAWLTDDRQVILVEVAAARDVYLLEEGAYLDAIDSVCVR